MTLIQSTAPMHQAAPRRQTYYRSEEELKMRDALEAMGRADWPGRRIVHELVMGRGTVRADMAFIGEDTFDVIEIKSRYDTAERLMNQVAMFSLAAPRLWLCAPEKHEHDIEIIRHLLPHVGLFIYDKGNVWPVYEAKPREPHPEALLSLCWVAELHLECERAGLWQSKRPPTHTKLVQMMQKLSPEEQLKVVCRRLRGRDALWRADPPIRSET